MHYNTLHDTTLHYITLHYTTLHLYCTTLHYFTLRYTARHYTTLDDTTPQDNTLHYATLHYTTIRYTTRHETALHHMTLCYAARRYSPLHNTTPPWPPPVHFGCLLNTKFDALFFSLFVHLRLLVQGVYTCLQPFAFSYTMCRTNPQWAYDITQYQRHIHAVSTPLKSKNKFGLRAERHVSKCEWRKL